MRNILQVSKCIIKISAEAGSIDSALKITQKAQNSEYDVESPKDSYNDKNPLGSQYYNVENPVDSLVPGGINAY